MTEEEIHRQFFPIIHPDEFIQKKTKIEYVNRGDELEYLLLWLVENEYTLWKTNDGEDIKCKWTDVRQYYHGNIRHFFHNLVAQYYSIYLEDDEITDHVALIKDFKKFQKL